MVNGQTSSIYITFGDFLLNLRRLYVHCIQRDRLTKLYFPEGLGGDWTYQNFEKSHAYFGGYLNVRKMDAIITSRPPPPPTHKKL